MTRDTRIAVNQNELDALKQAKAAMFGKESAHQVPHGLFITILSKRYVEEQGE